MRGAPLNSVMTKIKLLLNRRFSVIQTTVNKFPELHKKLLPILCIFVFVLLLIPDNTRQNTNTATNDVSERKQLKLEIKDTPPIRVSATENNNPTVEKTPVISQLNPDNITGSWNAYVIRKGDSVYRIFRKYKIPSPVLHQLIALETQDKRLTNVSPGQIMSFYISAENELIQLRITEADEETVIFNKRDDGSYIRSESWQ